MSLEEIIMQQPFPFEPVRKTLDIPYRIDDKVLLWAMGIIYGIMLGKQEAQRRRMRLEIRLTEEQAETLAECADRLKTSRTEVINKGVAMVKAELDKK